MDSRYRLWRSLVRSQLYLWLNFFKYMCQQTIKWVLRCVCVCVWVLCSNTLLGNLQGGGILVGEKPPGTKMYLQNQPEQADGYLCECVCMCVFVCADQPLRRCRQAQIPRLEPATHRWPGEKGSDRKQRGLMRNPPESAHRSLYLRRMLCVHIGQLCCCCPLL